MMRALTLAALAALTTQARAQDSTAVPLGDEYFAMKAYAEGLAEIAKSQLAYQKASDSGVKAFAEKMVKDHTECNEKIAELARKKGIALPTAIDAVHTTAIARLGRMSGSDFDKAYMMAQIGAHKDALHLFEHESHKGEDPELKALRGQDRAHAPGARQAGLRASGGEGRISEVLQDPGVRQAGDGGEVTGPVAIRNLADPAPAGGGVFYCTAPHPRGGAGSAVALRRPARDVTLTRRPRRASPAGLGTEGNSGARVREPLFPMNERTPGRDPPPTFDHEPALAIARHVGSIPGIRDPGAEGLARLLEAQGVRFRQ